MKQHQLIYDSAEQFERELTALRNQYTGKKAAIQFFYDRGRKEDVISALGMIERVWDDAECIGCTANASIHKGRLRDGTVQAVVMVFESPDTKLETMSFVLTEDTQQEMCDRLLQRIAEAGWVKGVEMLVTLRDLSSTYICDRLSKLPADIAVFGGAAFNREADRGLVEVFSGKDGFLEEGAVFLLMGGDSLSFRTTFISGWKPLGAKMTVSHSDRNRLYTLNGEPAFNAYNRYLNIGNDEHFYHNALEFPISYERNGISILRVPSQAMPDGSIVMTADIAEGSAARITYGDPQTILSSIFDRAQMFATFAADAILIFNCASRRSFWGTQDIDRETLPFSLLADTAGFYTGGEFHRMDWSLNQHNVTLVIAAIREGDADIHAAAEAHERLRAYYRDNLEYHAEHVSMVRRLANFIDVATEELADANRRLTRMASTDELTGLYNRREIKRMIERSEEYSLIMLDLDNFKMVNDTYGHDEGDTVLRSFSELVGELVDEAGALAGRWGGEEFMVLVPTSDSKAVLELAEKIREKYHDIRFERSGTHTVSCGVTSRRGSESCDSVFTRVDDALYSAKRHGRNCTCVK